MDDAVRLSRRQIMLVTAAVVLPAPRLSARPAAAGDGLRIVDGWVLTERDAAVLGFDAD